MPAALLPADWPARRGVRGLTTLRHGAGVSEAPFDHFNLGARCGDAAEAVTRNRAELVEIGGLPSAPVWLRQVHGAEVFRAGAAERHFACPHPSPLLSSAPPRQAAPGPRSARALTASRTCGSQTSRTAPQAGEGAVGSSPLPLAGEGARRADEGTRGNEPEADAAVTNVPGVVLAILTADCMPVLLCADDSSEVAAAHAGWRGLAAGVLEATVAAMRTPPDRLIAWLGPAAGPDNYEVGIEVHDAFVSQDRAAGSAFVSTRPHHWNVDLYALARRRLEQSGIAANRIFGGNLCTIGDSKRFYSHRRDQRTGRMASLVWIEPAR